jgi:hypothetical protein
VADIISTDHPLTEAQQALLRALLDTLVPASADGSMPSAAEVGFDAYLVSQAADFLPDLPAILEHFDAAFVDQPLDRRYERVSAFSADHPEAFAKLLTRVYDCYYQDDRVRTAIGVVRGEPFPQGNDVAAGDLSLLDPVITNAARHGYRKTL